MARITRSLPLCEELIICVIAFINPDEMFKSKLSLVLYKTLRQNKSLGELKKAHQIEFVDERAKVLGHGIMER